MCTILYSNHKYITDDAILLLKTGLRISEFCGLTINDIDFENRLINVDGYTDFLFLNQKGYPMTGANYTSTFRKMIKKYNKCHEETLPSITPHILMHTFCTRLANKNINPKNLQYVMSHSSINITSNLYAHTSIEDVKSEMVSLIA